MSHLNIINDILGICDKNISLDNDSYEELPIRGSMMKSFNATLSSKPSVCPACGDADPNSIIRYGFTKRSNIKLPKISGYRTILRLRKQRFLCKQCNSTFISSSNITNQSCYISNATKHSIALHASMKISEKDIASLNDVSHSTVNRILSSFKAYAQPSFMYLPQHMSFDEFKSVKSASGAMSFIYTDSLTGEIIDILEDRRLNKLIGYFMRFSKRARNSVKSIVIDMYSPYISLIKQVFPNARIVFDRFHIVQLFSRSLNRTRLDVMKKYKTNTLEYKVLKKHWKTLLRNFEDIDKAKFRYHYNFRRQMREVDVLEYMLGLDPVLKASYELFQDCRMFLKMGNAKAIKELLETDPRAISRHMNTSLATSRKYFEYIENAANSTISNGRLEGVNNLIKTIKRISFGYRNFHHFRNRIMIIRNAGKAKTA